jgi:hypothetical protein
MSDSRIDKALAKVEPTRREAIRKMIVGAAFTVPVVASFSMGGISISRAQQANGTGS